MSAAEKDLKVVDTNDHESEGVSPLYMRSALGELLVSDAAPKIAVQHMERRGQFGAICGSHEGQVTSMASAVTCPACREAMPKRRARRSR